MSTSTISNQTVFIPLPSGISQNAVADRGPRRSFPGQIIEWRTRDGKQVELGNSLEIKLMFFEMLRERVTETAYLPPGWNSGSGGPMSNQAIQNAVRLLHSLESARILPDTVIPTCDDSILIRYPLYNQTIEWEFFSEGDNVRAQIDPTGERSYKEVAAEEIERYV